MTTLPLINFSNPNDQLDYKWEEDLQINQETPNRYRSSIDNSKRNVQYIHQIDRTTCLNKTAYQQQQDEENEFSYKNSNELFSIQNTLTAEDTVDLNSVTLNNDQNSKNDPLNNNNNDNNNNNNSKNFEKKEDQNIFNQSTKKNDKILLKNYQESTQNSKDSSKNNENLSKYEQISKENSKKALLDSYVPISARRAREKHLEDKFQKTKGSFYTMNMSGKNFLGVQDKCIVASKGININGRNMVKEVSIDRADLFGKSRTQIKNYTDFKDFYLDLKKQGQHPDRLKNKFKHLLYGSDYCQQLENKKFAKQDKQVQYERMSQELGDLHKKYNYDSNNDSKTTFLPPAQMSLTNRTFRQTRSISNQMQSTRRDMTKSKIQQYNLKKEMEFKRSLSPSQKNLLKSIRMRGQSIDIGNRNQVTFNQYHY